LVTVQTEERAIASNALPARVSVHKVILASFPENTMQQVFKLTGHRHEQHVQSATEGVFGHRAFVTMAAWSRTTHWL
jgi:hypothetical protein